MTFCDLNEKFPLLTFIRVEAASQLKAVFSFMRKISLYNIERQYKWKTPKVLSIALMTFPY